MDEISKLIESIEKLRDSKVITYLTSDQQPPFSAKIANDAVRIFYDPLNKIGHVNKIDLFVHSLGGDTMKA
jgi:capsular polysaccharide biosynthesis protein